MYYILFYDYVENIAEKRAPYREGHLALIKKFQSEDKIILAGAYTDPLDCALLVFKVDDSTEVNKFVDQDPYAQNGLVNNWKIRSWNVVAGSAFTG